MSVQNPNIPTPTQAKGIDIAIYDMQARLDTSLTWLTNGMGRAYRLSKVEVNRAAIFLPEVRLNDGKFGYFAATPDNDKQGQNIFIVGDASFPDFQNNFYGIMSYPVSIIFSANLETIDSALLATEDFTEHLIQDVREALIRDPRGKVYRIVSIDSIQREFEDVYAEFDVSNDRGIAHNPMTHFRLNITIQLREDCADSSLDRCAAILANLSQDELLNCILPTYDFSDPATQNATTSQQQTDLTTWLCGGPVGYTNTHSLELDGVNDFIEFPNNAVFNIDRQIPRAITCWIKITAYNQGMIYAKYTGTSPFIGEHFRMDANGSLFFLLSAGSPNFIRVNTNASVLTLNAWNHVAITYDGSSTGAGCQFYVNGLPVTTNVLSPSVGASILTAFVPKIGATSSNTANFTGKMNEFRFWTASQNAAFILDDYNGGQPKAPADTANLISAPNFGEGALWQDIYFNWRCKDRSPVNIESYQTLNVAKAARQTDVP